MVFNNLTLSARELSGLLTKSSASSAAANTTALQTALGTAGSYTITTPGYYYLNPVNIAKDVALYLGQDVTLAAPNSTGTVFYGYGRLNITGPGLVNGRIATQESSASSIRGFSHTVNQGQTISLPKLDFMPPRKNLLAHYRAGYQNYTDTGAGTLATADGDRVGHVADLSGNNFHLQQSTAGDRAYLKTGGNGIGGRPAWQFGTTFGVSNPTDTFKLISINNTAGVALGDALAGNAFTIYIVTYAGNHSQLLCKLGIGSGVRFYMGRDGGGSYTGQDRSNYSSTSAQQAVFTANNLADRIEVASWCINPGGSNESRYLRGLYQVPDGPTGSQVGWTAQTLSGHMTVGNLNTGNYCWSGLIGEIIIYKEAHDKNTQAAINQKLMAMYGLNTPVICLEGNSWFTVITVGGGLIQSTNNYVIKQLQDALQGTYTFVNSGTAGAATTDLIALQANRFDHLPAQDARGRCIYVLFEAYNDMAEASKNLSAAAAATNIQTICLARQAAGHRVVYVTCPPRNATAGAGGPNFETKRRAFNDLLRANPQAYGIDALADPGSDTSGGLWDVANLTTTSGYWQNDLTHLSPGGSSEFVSYIVSAIRTLM